MKKIKYPFIQYFSTEVITKNYTHTHTQIDIVVYRFMLKRISKT